MTKTLRRAISCAVTVVLLAGGTVTMAQGLGSGRLGPRGFRGAPGIELRGANLTDAQREQIRTLLEQYRETGAPLREQLQQLRETLREALAAVPVNEEFVRSTTQALGTAQTEAVLVQARLRAGVLALLMPDQLQGIEDARNARRERAGEIRERLDQRRQQR